jgi:hypothetical protein
MGAGFLIQPFVLTTDLENNAGLTRPNIKISRQSSRRSKTFCHRAKKGDLRKGMTHNSALLVLLVPR